MPTDPTGWPAFPTVYEINTWVWLRELGRDQRRPMTLASVPQAELERLAGYGFDALWLMGVWQRSPGARRVAREHPDLQPGYRAALPDYTAEDVIGSPYAIYRYRVDPVLGGDEGLDALRERLRALGLRVILDFVPNHVAYDHPWVAEHPERLLQAKPEIQAREPHNYFASNAHSPPRVFAHGRDPHFPGWTDTVQLDYRQPGTRQAMADTLSRIAGHCDGVRCDMAMLVNREIFLRTWGGLFDPPRAEFWPAAITQVKARHPGFLMMAEAYWDMEWELQQMGFDYTYDKRLYDRLLGADTAAVRGHLRAELDYQRRLTRFIENHDEERALSAFGAERCRAVATLALTLPGLRLFHEGQLQGRRARLPVQLARRRPEPPEPNLEAFYRCLLAALRHPVFHDGEWQLLEPAEGGTEHADDRQVVAHFWALDGHYRLVAANLAPHPVRYRLSPTPPALHGRTWRLIEQLEDTRRVRVDKRLPCGVLELDLPGYGHRLIELQPA